MHEITGSIGFGILAIIVLFLAKKGHYFTFPKEASKWEVPVRWYHVVSVFAIYFVAVVIVVPMIASLLTPLLSSAPRVAVATWLNFLASFIILGAVAIYSSLIPRDVASKIWRENDRGSFLRDIGFALLSFVVAFPLVIFFNEILDLFLYQVFHVKELPDQLAVRFLKMTFEHPRYFFLSVVTIVVFAPMLEEALFRGFFQSFIRQHMGSKSAIWITSLCFAVFHYSPEQGLSNISIIGSLFVLALFLGFVYERQRSLVSSMALHASFNAISVLNLYFLGGFPKTL